MKSLGLPDPIAGVENLAKDAISIAMDLTKQAVSSVVEKLVLNPIKGVSLAVLKAIFAIPTIPLLVRGENSERAPLSPLKLPKGL